MGSILLAAALVATVSCTSSDKKQSTSTTRPGCAVTKASDRKAAPPAALREALGESVDQVVGSGNLWVFASPDEHGDRFADGTYELKIGWFRGIAGPLIFNAERIDGRANVRIETTPSGYPPTGFLPSSVVASAPGCYRLTGTLGDSKATVVVKIADAPPPDT